MKYLLLLVARLLLAPAPAWADDETAVVAFRLLGTSADEPGQSSQYFNTGTFRKKNDEWRAVAWQATRIPPAD